MMAFAKIDESKDLIDSKMAIKAVLDMIENGEMYPIKGSGDSMRPFLNEKDTLIVTAVGDRKIRAGDILLYERANGQYVFHRVYKDCKNKQYSFVGDNQFFVEKGIRRDQLRAYVKKVIRNGKEIDCERGCIRGLMIIRMYMRVNVFRLYYLCRKIRKTLQKKDKRGLF